MHIYAEYTFFYLYLLTLKTSNCVPDITSDSSYLLPDSVSGKKKIPYNPDYGWVQGPGLIHRRHYTTVQQYRLLVSDLHWILSAEYV